MLQPQPPLPCWHQRSAPPCSPQEAFAGTWARAGGGLDPAARGAIWEQLRTAYSASGRHHHNLAHIVETLAFVGTCIQAGQHINDLAAVEWALWWHDFVYDAQAPDNEARSADAARRALQSAGMAPAAAARVGGLIMATAAHLHGPDPDAAVVVDADMCVLGAPLPRYAAYAAAVRREYAHLSDVQFAAGRTQFLRRMLEREQLFATGAGMALCDQARANMAHELQLTAAGLLCAPDGELPSVAEADEEGGT